MSLFTMPLFLDNKTAPVATLASDGTFVLTLLAYAPIYADIKDAWCLIFTGLAARDFWQRHANDLVPGVMLLAGVDLVRPFHAGHSAAEIHAAVSSIEINTKEAAPCTSSI
jgi:hypothetical protein